MAARSPNPRRPRCSIPDSNGCGHLAGAGWAHNELCSSHMLAYGLGVGLVPGVGPVPLQGKEGQVLPDPYLDPPGPPMVVPVKTLPPLPPDPPTAPCPGPGVPGLYAITGLPTAIVTSSAAAIIIRYIMILMSFSNPSESIRRSQPMTVRLGIF